MNSMSALLNSLVVSTKRWISITICTARVYTKVFIDYRTFRLTTSCLRGIGLGVFFCVATVNLTPKHGFANQHNSSSSTIRSAIPYTEVGKSLSSVIISLHAPDYERLADAIYRAEGGAKASRPYGIMFEGCDKAHPQYCRRICINTLKNTYKRWISAQKPLPYLEFLRNRYAPLSHHPLNRNWLKNVEILYAKGI